jgi:transposase-like protein
MLAMIGATPEGKKEPPGVQVGVRERAQSWRELLVDLKARGLPAPPDLAVGDGAPGFRKAQEEVFPDTRHQGCWTHEVSNVLNRLPTSMHPAVKADLRKISQAATRAPEETAAATFVERYGVKYEKPSPA